MSANRARRLLAIAPLVFWNWCQSPESLYRECLFNAADGLGQSPYQWMQVEKVCREAADFPTASNRSAAPDHERTAKPPTPLEELRRSAPAADPAPAPLP